MKVELAITQFLIAKSKNVKFSLNIQLVKKKLKYRQRKKTVHKLLKILEMITIIWN